MSSSESGEDDRPRREVAWRLFAAEFDDADYQFAESDEERAPNYVVTPTGARVNRLFVVGVLTSVEQVNEDVVRARVVDPTGAFVVYAGQYQPDALASLENADVPSFVAVTGKARTFSPDDSDQVYTSVRPESVNAVTPETRDRWVVTTAERTLARVSTFADALELPERGDDLTDALAERDVPYGLASGISHAIQHYGTTPAYLAAVRELALDATRVVAGEQDEVEDLALAPSEGDGTDADLSYAGAELGDVESSAPVEERAEVTPEGETVSQESEPSPDDFETEASEAESETGTAESEPEAAEVATSPDTEAARTETTGEDESATIESEPSPDDFDVEAETHDLTESEPAESVAEETEAEPASESTNEEVATARTEATGEGEPATAESEPSPDDFDAESEEGAVEPDEEWEMDEETRAEVEEQFDVGFSSGTEFSEGDEVDEAEESLGDFEAGGDFEEESDETAAEFTESEYDEPESETEDAESPPADLDLEDVVVDYMDTLDEGNGADRDELVRTVLEETDADEDEIADAIQSALMSGRCYESGDDHLKAI
ncbi:hypothetical protein [Halarchaeum sp. P4]|uniref:RPA family protein n=1 Tax=Halarchaeum sp. P4 TaxID=3421639 RepID=UPI003EBE0172